MSGLALETNIVSAHLRGDAHNTHSPMPLSEPSNPFLRPISARFGALVAVLAASLMLATPCFAEQFVLFDVTFPFTQEDALNSKPNQSHYYVKEPVLNTGRPKDWTAPVDYRNGTVHVRLEVIGKPSGFVVVPGGAL